MSEQITGEQLEASAGEWNPWVATCEECGWTGDSEDLHCVMSYGTAGKMNVQNCVCPSCGSENIEEEA